MKKYIPSIQNNNELKNEALEKINTLIYKLSKKKYNLSLNEESVENALGVLKSDFADFENAVGTGKEDIESIYKSTINAVDKLSKEMNQALTSRFENAVDELSFSICMWKDVTDGELISADEINIEKQKLGWSKRRLSNKLSELKEIKEDYQKNEQRLEAEIKAFEKEITELEDKMLDEDNQRILNDIYRNITATKSKIDSLNVRRSNYSVCFNLLDMIELNIGEIVVAGEYATSELNKAKGMLNMKRIREMAVNPDKAIPILKVLQDDIKKISDKIKSVDEKVFTLSDGENTISNDALSYKEELMKKRREKELMKSANNEIDSKLSSESIEKIDVKITTDKGDN